MFARVVTVVGFVFMVSGTAVADPLNGASNSSSVPGVRGENTGGGVGVFGISNSWQGVHGESDQQAGVVGVSKGFVGVWGESQSPGHPGVFGISKKWQGVHGESEEQAGVVGVSKNFVGVWAESSKADAPGIFAKGPTVAGRFEGNLEVTGDILSHGQKIGLKGPEGPRGPQGVQGPPGPVVTSAAVCAEQEPGVGTSKPACSCSVRAIIPRQAGPCTVQADTGSCTAAANGCCAVCAP